MYSEDDQKEKCWFIFIVFNCILTHPIFKQQIITDKRAKNKNNLKLPDELTLSTPKPHIYPHIHT